MKKWQCTVCGYIHQGEEPPETCPVCGADKSLFVPYTEEAAEAPVSAPEVKSETAAATRWQCTVCGYIHTGDEPPEECPVCGADKSLFVRLTDTVEEAPSPSGPQAARHEDEGRTRGAIGGGLKAPWEGNERLTELAKMLTRLHGHPIAVHIPNGVLPVAVLFGLLALLFKSHAFAVAATYNMVFVCLAMPIVIGTGLVDWINRFDGRMTYIFKNKLICAGVVTLLSLVLGIWWIAAPELYQQGLFAHWFFFLLHLIDLGAAGLAGWFGGKLVFK